MLVSYSSGAGVSGVIGSFCYAALCEIGLTPKTILISTIIVPLVGLVAFLLIEGPDALSTTSIGDGCIDDSYSTTKEDPPTTFQEKLRYLPKLTKYFIPMLINCLFEYIIGQTVGLFQLK